MNADETILHELKQISPSLAAYKINCPYRVPAGYFESLAEQMIARSKEPVPAWKSTGLHAQDVPEGYFQDLSSKILAKIQQGTDSDLHNAPFWKNVQKNHPGRIPEGYFESLPGAIAAKVSKPAVVISMRGRVHFMRQAVAAALIGMVGFSLFNLVGRPPKTEVPDEVIQEARSIVANNSFDKAWESLSDEEMSRYLLNSGQDLGTALVASLATEENLPDPTDYLLDENTLETFTGSILTNNGNNP